ncbi:peptidylprolyl isomerase [Brevundimonas sp. Leaf363]|uniref:peptidylprolyl isomerase n=1 Tax=Brevundimonas sp. Leaf363 TaxID=1736353 RepID=UPI0006FA3678|nr:peptidylprolyl isomerase [Brevundimonas sp. Leaf363]KQS55724.1 peptidylprolyl isomerase [Brevundimonas sp. Leaf363]
MVRGAVFALALGLLASPCLAQTAPSAADDWRTVSADNLLVLDTSRGRVLVEMSPEAAPLHVERMRLLAGRGFFDGLTFHRVIDWFMAQTGDPLGTGEGQSAYPDLTAEFTFRRGPQTPFVPVAQPQGSMTGFMNALPIETQPDALMGRTPDGKVHAWGIYCPGVAGMARGDANDSANSQFFLMRQAYPSLDKRYTAWGRVIDGLSVIRALKASGTPDGLVADSPDRLTRVRVAADIPEAERPTAQMLSTASARFQALVAETRQSRGADFSVCDIDLPVQVSGAQAAPAA